LSAPFIAGKRVFVLVLHSKDKLFINLKLSSSPMDLQLHHRMPEHQHRTMVDRFEHKKRAFKRHVDCLIDDLWDFMLGEVSRAYELGVSASMPPPQPHIPSPPVPSSVSMVRAERPMSQEEIDSKKEIIDGEEPEVIFLSPPPATDSNQFKIFNSQKVPTSTNTALTHSETLGKAFLKFLIYFYLLFLL